jgi:hypothetical protein
LGGVAGHVGIDFLVGHLIEALGSNPATALGENVFELTVDGDMETLFRYLACVLLLALAPSCLAQTVAIRVISANDARPLQKQHVSVSLLYVKGEATPAKYDANLTFETDVNGEVHFVLPEPAPTHMSAQVHLTSEHWRCGCGIVVATDDLIQKGIVGPPPEGESRKSAAPVKTVPGEILFVARPLSFLERLLYPFVKG